MGRKLFDAPTDCGIGRGAHGEALWVVGGAAPCVLIATGIVVGEEGKSRPRLWAEGL